ncbi:hypothetical protein ABW20_dc0107315 [Dactylellina cionopaga]|nr:hypothetical protein ABW20_dc0107315 [Dactylellina cionopaga]
MVSKYPLRITTPRLTIRSAVASDAQGLCDFFSKGENLPPGAKAEPNLSAQEFERRIEKWKGMALEGKNSFLIVTLRDEGDNQREEEGEVRGELTGFGGYNTFEKLSEEPVMSDSATTGESEEVPMLTDIGILIDIKHRRRGYALEALLAQIDFAFDKLSCRKVRIETGTGNEPFRRFMVDKVRLGQFEKEEGVSYREGEEVGYVYSFGSREWKGREILP